MNVTIVAILAVLVLFAGLYYLMPEGIPGMENLGWSASEAEEKVVESVRSTLSRIFQMAEDENITTDEAACKIAEENLSIVRPEMKQFV